MQQQEETKRKWTVLLKSFVILIVVCDASTVTSRLLSSTRLSSTQLSSTVSEYISFLSFFLPISWHIMCLCSVDIHLYPSVSWRWLLFQAAAWHLIRYTLVNIYATKVSPLSLLSVYLFRVSVSIHYALSVHKWICWRMFVWNFSRDTFTLRVCVCSFHCDNEVEKRKRMNVNQHKLLPHVDNWSSVRILFHIHHV